MDTCILCKSSKKDDIQYGEFLRNNRFGVHTFCLYLSSNLSQNGADNEGFLGFLEPDIQKEVKRISYLKCCYCHKMYANVGCCEKKCRSAFHFICGLENYAENQFCNQFLSFCHRHVSTRLQRPSSTETCLICYDSLCTPEKGFNAVNMILTPCCRNGWFHKLCLQKFAKTAGYFFKCPLCNDAEIFRQKLPARGIFIPNQDAAWELEPNAFAELLERPSECSAQNCKNKNGRKAKSELNPFVMCSTCGSKAMHKECLLNGSRRFHCEDCTVALEDGDSGRESFNSQNNHDDEDIDVCYVSDKEDLEIVKRIIHSTTNNENENKRDSGPHHDNQINSSSTRGIRCFSTGSESSETEMPSVSNTSRHKHKRRIRSDTENSENSEKEEIIRPVCSSQIRRMRIKSSESQEGKDRREEQREKGIKPVRVAKHKMERRVSESSDTTDLEGENVFENIKSDTEMEMVIKPSCSSRSRRLASESESSEKNSIQNKARKRKTSELLTDIEDEDEVTLGKQKRLKCKSSKILKDESDTECQTEEDDDPLENFEKFLKKQKNISCIALRTRQKYQIVEQFEEIQRRQENKDKTNEKESKENYTRNVTKGKIQDFTKDENNVLDISCIAKRTRRKSMHSTVYSKPQLQTLTEQNENPLNTSCIAVRTRRKTICAQTPQEYSKKVLYEMSRIYERTHESEDEIKKLTDDESQDGTERSVSDFIVDDGYQKKDSKFEISCIANRTRKRKSLRYTRKDDIEEEEEEDDNSSTSTTFSITPFTRRLNRNITHRKRSGRILSSSEEFSGPEISCNKTTHHCSQLLEKMPHPNINNYLKPKYVTLHNYHATHHHRKRL